MTRIIQRLVDGVVLYAGDDLTLDTSGAASADWRDPSTTADNAQLVEGVTLPTPWTGGAYTFDGSSFAVHDAALLAPAAAAVPASVSRRQARQALLLAGKLGLVQPAIDAIPDALQRGLMQIEWDDSQDFVRNRPTLIAIASALGLDSAGIDALFIQAARL